MKCLSSSVPQLLVALREVAEVSALAVGQVCLVQFGLMV